MYVIENCPFCGDFAFLMKDSTSLRNYLDLPAWFVQCHGCGIRTLKGEMSEVITTWNRRVKDESNSNDVEEEMD